MFTGAVRGPAGSRGGNGGALPQVWSTGTLEALAEAVDLLCRAYPVVPAAVLRDRTHKRLAQVNRLLSGRLTLDQHRELLVITGWLTALLGCVHYDLGEREEAETARRAAFDIDRRSLTDLVNRAGDLDRVLRQRYRREALAEEFHERFITARRALTSRRPDLLD